MYAYVQEELEATTVVVYKLPFFFFLAKTLEGVLFTPLLSNHEC